MTSQTFLMMSSGTSFDSKFERVVTDALCNYSVKDRLLGCPSDSRVGPSPSVLFPQIEVEFQQIGVY